MVATKGRQVASIAEAEEFLRDFIAENSNRCGKTYDPHSHDFDLYLPWVFECVANSGAEGSLSVCELSVLLMDAAWSLSQKGFLRPGPRSVMGQDIPSNGKGYSLTPMGRTWARGPAELR